MERFFFAILAAVLVSDPDKPVWADDTQATAVLDKAIHALGGEDKLGKIQTATWKAKGKITRGENGKGKIAPGDIEECDFTRQVTEFKVLDKVNPSAFTAPKEAAAAH